MKKNPLRLVLDTVAGQVIVMVVVAIMAIHAILTLHVYWISFQGRMPNPPGVMTGQTAAFVGMVENTPRPDRDTIVAIVNKAEPRVNARMTDRLPDGAALIGPNHLTVDVGPTVQVFSSTPDKLEGNGEIWGDLYFQFSDGNILYLFLPKWDDLPPIGAGYVTLIFIAVAASLLVGWATIVITGPLRRFAAAVENFRDMRDTTVLPEDGPREIRAAIAAFNRMRTRIGKLMADRTAMLAAVSHDLRTPITRLRLRAEFIDDVAVRGPILADLDHMAALTQAALTHLSGSESREQYESTDLPSLLQTIADQYSDTGHDVVYHGPQRLTASVRLRDIQRAVTNLVDNAVRYGSHVTIALAKAGASVVEIAILDDGPGIAETDRARLLEPFERGDTARTSAPNTGFGLGLSIASDIAEAHGGALRLDSVAPHGLKAILTIATR